MSFRPHPRGARVNPDNPQAWGTCDKCGFVVNLRDMDWHREWAGTQIINLGYLNCPRCRTVPNEQLRTIILPPDPDAVMNARPENYLVDEMPMIFVDTTRRQLRVVLDPARPRGPPRGPLLVNPPPTLLTSP